MHPSSQKLLRRRLDAELEKLKPIFPRQRQRGWIKLIRSALGMSAAELARRLNVTRAAVHHLERSENAQTITLASLESVARRLECELVYALVPKTSLEGIVKSQAIKAAAVIAKSVRHSMRLESQEPTSEENQRQLEAMAEELVNSPRQLWSTEV